MNAEKVLSYAIKIKESLPEEEKKIVDAYLRMESADNPLAALILDARKEVVETKAKRNGRSDMLTLAKTIIKNAGTREALNGAFYQTRYNPSDTHQYFCDGYMLLRLQDRLDLPEIDKNVTPINVSNLTALQERGLVELPGLPTVGELKAFVSEVRASGKISKRECPYYAIENGPHINAEWLMKAIKAFPNGKAYTYGVGSRKNSILVIKDEERDESITILGTIER